MVPWRQVGLAPAAENRRDGRGCEGRSQRRVAVSSLVTATGHKPASLMGRNCGPPGPVRGAWMKKYPTAGHVVPMVMSVELIGHRI